MGELVGLDENDVAWDQTSLRRRRGRTWKELNLDIELRDDEPPLFLVAVPARLAEDKQRRVGVPGQTSAFRRNAFPEPLERVRTVASRPRWNVRCRASGVRVYKKRSGRRRPRGVRVPRCR